MKGWPVPFESDVREDEIRLVSEDKEEVGGVLYVLGENENEAEGVADGQDLHERVNVVSVVDGSASWLTEMYAIPKPLLSLRRVRRRRVLAGSNERSGWSVQ